MFDYNTTPIISLYCHLGVHICSTVDTAFHAGKGWKITKMPDGVVLQSPDTAAHNTQPNHYAFVPWANVHSLAYGRVNPTLGESISAAKAAAAAARKTR